MENCKLKSENGKMETFADKKQGYENQVADISHQDEIKIRVTVPETALYQICFDYLSYDQPRSGKRRELSFQPLGS